MSSRHIRLLIALFGMIALSGAACGGNSPVATPPTTQPGPAAKVTPSPATATIIVGATQQFTAAVADANGNALTSASVTWTATPASVATVSSSGMATAVAAGTATITATSGSVSGSATLTVTPPPVASVTVAPAAPSIKVGATQQFTASALDAKGNPIAGASFTWASSATSVATINSSGLATGVAAGTTNIIATSGGVSSPADVLTVVQPSAITGTAAIGAPLAAATVTCTDAKGATATASTAADGTFSINSTGMTPPFLLSVQPTAGATLYGVSADASLTTSINIDPLTDLITRGWYSAQGAAVGTVAAPTPVQVQVLSSFVQDTVQLWLNNNGVTASGFNLLSTPFAANGSGLDKVLDQATINPAQGTVAITDGTTTQNTQITFTPATNSISQTTTTTSGGVSTTSSTSTVVPSSAPQTTVLQALQAVGTAMTQVITAKGAQLASTDLTPFFTSTAMFEGLNQAQFAAELATLARGNAAAFTITALNSVSSNNLSANAHVIFQLGTAQLSTDMNFALSGTTWQITGDGRVAGLGLDSNFNVQQTGTVLQQQSSLDADVKAPPATVTAATLTGGGIFSATPFTAASQISESFQPTPGGSLAVLLDHFNLGATLTSLVPAGTPFTFNLTTSSGPVSYTLTSNANTTEGIQFTGITSSSLSALTLGGNNTFSWTLPKTFAVSQISFKSLAFNGDPSSPATTECRLEQQLSNIAATSGTIAVPATCANSPVVQVQIVLDVTGPHGEETEVSAIYH